MFDRVENLYKLQLLNNVVISDSKRSFFNNTESNSLMGYFSDFLPYFT